MAQSSDDGGAGNRLPTIQGAICVPHRATGWPRFWKAIEALSKPAGTALISNEGTGIATQRNRLVKVALGAGARWILFADDDHTFPPNALERLLRHEVPIVGALCVTKHPPHVITAKKRMGDGWRSLLPEEFVGKGLIEVDAVGMGLTLIRREVFEAVGEPWFKFEFLADGLMSEDVWFCHQAGMKGFQSYVDAELRIAHMTVAEVIVTADGRVEATV